MSKQAGFGLFFVASMILITGCATTPRREARPEIPVTQPAPAAQPSVSDQEAERMKKQIEEQQAALAKAEADRRALEEQLNQALATKKAPAKKDQDSYLK